MTGALLVIQGFIDIAMYIAYFILHRTIVWLVENFLKISSFQQVLEHVYESII